jgi:enoyl-CoA hydratase/carnithine racemase
MNKAMRDPGLRTLGFDGVLDCFSRGRLPASPEELVTKVFGREGDRGSLVISGVNGIVGAGKAMQLGSRLYKYGVKVVGLDFPGAPDGIGRHYAGLVRTFGREDANRIMAGIIRLNYDGARLPSELAGLKPRFLLEAIPEILEAKRAHYAMFRVSFPEIEIRSVTSGFPGSALGVSVAHPAFPHEINKVWEVVEPQPSDITRLLWAVGMIPIPVGDYWSFVLDVLFCGLTHAAVKYHEATNMPFWKIDKWVRRMLGPNPFRAHDAIGAKGADFLTWSCLHHLGEKYGELFRPTPTLVERKDSGLDWYPPEQFRPLVDWKLEAAEVRELETRIIGPLLQMTSLMLHEKRAALPYMNIIGELCAQFRRGVLAVARELGPDECRRRVAAWHALCPAMAGSAWHPEVFDQMDQPEWRQLYVNAEHDGRVGVISIGRESYNWDVDAELNRAIDWLQAEGIRRVIVSGDFHVSTQLVGADTSDFYAALENIEEGIRISGDWSRTARRLDREFEVSVGFAGGKRVLGGCLELLMHCHYLVGLDATELGMPEVTLPVVPGMEGCHWPFRKARPEDRPHVLRMLLEGRPVKAKDAVGWLVDFAGPLEAALQASWQVASGGPHGIPRRLLEEGALPDVTGGAVGLAPAGSSAMEAARAAIVATIRESCGVPLAEAVVVQARHSAGFMVSAAFRAGRIGSEAAKTLAV